MILMKKVSLVFMAFAMVTGLTACGDKVTISAEKRTNSEVPKETKKYVIATNTYFAPFEFQNDLGEYVGIDMDLLDAIAKDQGFTYETVKMPFNEVLTAVEEGRVDGALAGISITDERREKLDFSDPYLEGGVVMAVAATRQDINNYEDLAGKTVAVAVARGTEAEAFAQSIKDIYNFKITTFNEFSDVYIDVLEGNSQALFEDYPVMGYIISRGVDFKIVSDIERKSPYGFAVPKGKNQELLEMFNKGLKNLKENGKYQEIMDTYVQS
ncbi:transporter substrate-binding domain-containing protein [Anaerotignum sp.]|uniref:transporter substrate-binding domain-containing protein n=1 Tax=Anaerotignum sp. TaxID=2039241 RepID=UPI0028A6FE0E|nr:transporter substrate-binding domain-containing protein [Anaerotignum sp.]